jgi:hypothetical protein
VTEVLYLGHIIASSMSDEPDMQRQKRFMYCRGNQLSRNFSNCSTGVKRLLFKAYCYNLYCNSLWFVFRVEMLRRVKVAYNTAFRLLFQYRRSEHISPFFVNNRVNDFVCVTRRAAFSLRNRIDLSQNVIVNACKVATHCSVLRGRWRTILEG